jgi:hypothetical protein
MYPRNAASPEPVAIGAVVQISDGAVQTSGCTVRIKPIGVAEGDGAGTTAYSTDGIVLYTPTQAETNYTSFVLIAKKTGCIPACVTVVTTASSVPGRTMPADGSVTAAVIATDAIDADAIKADAVTEIQSGLATPTNITAATGITLAAVTHTGAVIPTVTTVTNGLDAAGVRTAIGLTVANLDTQLADLPTVAEFEARSLPAASYFVVGDYTQPPSASTISSQVAADLAVAHGVGAWTTATGFSTLSQADIRTAVGLTTANLDTQISNIQSDTNDIQARLPAALESGRIAAALDSATTAAVADAVLTESILDHRNVAHSLAKYIWQIRQANLTIDGTVSNAITPTTLTFSSNVVATTSAYAHAVLLFTTGPLAGENSPIISYDSTNGVFLLEEPLTAAPSNGDEFVVIAGSHVHSVADIQSGLATAAALATESGKITNIENASGYLLAVLAGACADPQTASETYAITVFGSTFTVDMAGQTSTGTRTAPTLTKT